MELRRSTFYHYRVPVAVLVLFILVAGVYSYRHIRTSLLPDVKFPRIRIILDAGQVPVDKMIPTVTVPVENLVKGTEGFDDMRSRTSRGSCEISVQLKWGTDVDKARQQIESSVNQYLASMPNRINATVEKMSMAMLPVMAFSLEGNRSAVELKNIALYQIKPFLSEVDGVSNVAVIGGKTKEYQIQVKPERLSELHITLAQIQQAITQENIFQSNGYIIDHNRMYLSLTNNELENIEELKNLVIENNASRLVLLRDVADMTLGEAREYSRTNANVKDLPLVAVLRQPDANVIKVTYGIESKWKELQRILPPGVNLQPFYRQADFETESIDGLQMMMWFGLALSILVVILFLPSFSTSLAVIISIPFSMTLTLVALNLLGYSFNIMTLGAVTACVGLMMDDVVTIAEHIHRNRMERHGVHLSTVITDAIKSLLPAMIASSISTIVIFIPYILMSGAAGAYFKVLAFTMVLSLTASFIVSRSITPVLFLLFTPRKKRVHTGAGMQQPPSGWIRFLLRFPVTGILFALLCGFLIFWIPGKLPTGFLPEFHEDNIIINVESPLGTTLEETDRMLLQVDTLLKHQPEIASFSRRIGTQIAFAITEPNRGDILIRLKPGFRYAGEEVADRLRRLIEKKLPALRVDFGQIVSNTLGELVNNRQPVEVKVFGDDANEIDSLSKQIKKEIETTPGTADVFDGLVMTGPEINIRPNVPLLAQLGLTPSDFQFQLQTQTEGNVISTIIDRDQLLNVRLIYPHAYDTRLHSLMNTNILLPGGTFKPIRSVASIELAPGEAVVNRENQKRMGVVTAQLHNRDLGSTLQDIRHRIDTHIQLPSGYHIEYGGSWSQQRQSFRELFLIFLCGLVLVFVVMLFLLRNLRIAFLILLLTALGIAGCLLALYLTGTPLNISSYTGLILTGGIIGENALFTYYQLEELRKHNSLRESLIQTLAGRLRPKLVTILAALVTFIPLVLATGTGAEVHRPLAIALLGGLLFALPLLLVVLPVFEILTGSEQLPTDDADE